MAKAFLSVGIRVRVVCELACWNTSIDTNNKKIGIHQSSETVFKTVGKHITRQNQNNNASQAQQTRNIYDKMSE